MIKRQHQRRSLAFHYIHIPFWSIAFLLGYGVDYEHGRCIAIPGRTSLRGVITKAYTGESMRRVF